MCLVVNYQLINAILLQVIISTFDTADYCDFTAIGEVTDSWF